MLYIWFMLCWLQWFKIWVWFLHVSKLKDRKHPEVCMSEHRTPVRRQEPEQERLPGPGVRDISINPAFHGMESDQLKGSWALLFFWSHQRWGSQTTPEHCSSSFPFGVSSFAVLTSPVHGQCGPTGSQSRVHCLFTPATPSCPPHLCCPK